MTSSLPRSPTGPQAHDVLAAYTQRWIPVIAEQRASEKAVDESAVTIAMDSARGVSAEAKKFSPTQRSNIAAVALASAIMKKIVDRNRNLSPVQRHDVAKLLPVFMASTVAVPFTPALSTRFMAVLNDTGKPRRLETALSMIRKTAQIKMQGEHYAQLHRALLSGDNEKIGAALAEHSDKSGRVGLASWLWQTEKNILGQSLVSSAAYCLFSAGVATFASAGLATPAAVPATAACLAAPATELVKSHLSGWGGLGVGKLLDGVFHLPKKFLGWDPDAGVTGAIVRQAAGLGLMTSSFAVGEQVRAAQEQALVFGDYGLPTWAGGFDAEKARREAQEQERRKAQEYGFGKHSFKDVRRWDDEFEAAWKESVPPGTPQTGRKFENWLLRTFHPDKRWGNTPQNERDPDTDQEIHDRWNYLWQTRALNVRQ